MEKISEKWSSNGITSTFKVLLEGDRPLCVNKGTVPSDICGFGWLFSIYADYSNIHIYFDPNLLRYSNLGALEVTAICKSDSGIVANEPRKINCQLSGYTGYSNSTLALASYTTSEITTTPLLEFTVTLPTNIHLPLPQKPISPETTQLLNYSLLGGESIDTKFYLFSRRMPGKRAGRPLPLFTSSSILKGQSSYLDTLWSSEGFQESTSVDLSTAIISESVDAEYDYASDSDLESISADDLGDGDYLAAGSDIEDTPSLPSSTPAMEVPYYSPTLDGSASINSGPTGRPKAEDPPCVIGGSSSGQPSGVHQGGHRLQMGRMIFRKHTAFATWEAFLFYLHTKEIRFSTLKSRRALSHETPAINALSRIPSCSPKSMYRLADELHEEDLKELAFNAIASNLTEENIVQELFSSFTFWYPPIRVMEIKALGRYYNKPGVIEQMERMVPLIVVDSRTHTIQVLKSLLSRLNPDELSRISIETEIEKNEEKGLAQPVEEKGLAQPVEEKARSKGKGKARRNVFVS